MIDLTWTNPKMKELQDIYNANLPKTLYLNHYELSATLGNSAIEWREFMLDPRVNDYIQQELRILKLSEMQKLVKDISTKSKSVGTAQMLTALSKSLDGEKQQEGPAFIYMYVPLNEREQQADNVIELDEDPFRREP